MCLTKKGENAGRNMVEIDLKDRKILYQLDLNCRQSNAQIGKKVGLSKQVVDYRIKKMEEEGVITGYWTAINTYKLGYYVFRIYINLIDVSTKIKTDIIQYFVKNKNAWAVLTSKGPVDLDVILWVNDVYAFNQYWINTLQKFGKYFSQSTISILTHVMSCKKTYLFDSGANSSDRMFYQTSCEGKPIQIDALDYQILDELALNARTPLLDLAKKINCSPQTVNYRIKNLVQKDIIQAFRVSIYSAKLGLQGCAVDLFLKDQTMRRQILEYIKQKPNIYDIMVMNIGWGDICFQVFISNMNDLSRLMEDIETKFPDAIRKYEYWMDQVVHKERWLPEMTEADFKKT
jgi:DNA-binding Lrp family transcriptional regulator